MSAASRALKDPLTTQQLLERGAANELHPEPDPALARLGAVDADDVRVTETGQDAALAQDPLVQTGGRAAGAQQLERDLAMQLRVEGPEHLAEGALPHPFADLEVPPPRGDVARRHLAIARRDRHGRQRLRLDPADDLADRLLAVLQEHGRRLLSHRWLHVRIRVGLRAMHVGDAREDPKLPQQLTIARRLEIRFDRVPIDVRRTVGHRSHDALERHALARHDRSSILWPWTRRPCCTPRGIRPAIRCGTSDGY